MPTDALMTSSILEPLIKELLKTFGMLGLLIKLKTESSPKFKCEAFWINEHTTRSKIPWQ